MSSDSDTMNSPQPSISSELPENVQLLRSCESCRRKKRKCSGERPTCTRCQAQGDTCIYRPTARFLKPRNTGVRKPAKKKRVAERPRAMSAAISAGMAPGELCAPSLTITPAGLSPTILSETTDNSPRQEAGLSYMTQPPLTPMFLERSASTASPQTLSDLQLAPQPFMPSNMTDYSQFLATTMAQQAALISASVGMEPLPPLDPMSQPLSWPLSPMDSLLGSFSQPLSQDSRTNIALDTILPQSKNLLSEWFVQ
ncbi:hypothetical protein BX667DRAFT_518155 [Coemansia mojavensis]|nr:hypothetical protein BX667DRAFT_518155 [Coemansia mojavensis]